MTQKNIRNYFSSTQTNSTISTDSDSESEESDVNTYVSKSADISYYEDLFKRKDEIKKMAKVEVNATGISECWKHFGSLYIKNKQIMEKYKFCKICLDTEGALKG